MIFGSILKKIPINHGNELECIQRIKSVNEGHNVIVPNFEILDVKNNEIHVQQDYVRGDILNSYKCFPVTIRNYHIHIHNQGIQAHVYPI